MKCIIKLIMLLILSACFCKEPLPYCHKLLDRIVSEKISKEKLGKVAQTFFKQNIKNKVKCEDICQTAEGIKEFKAFHVEEPDNKFSQRLTCVIPRETVKCLSAPHKNFLGTPRDERKEKWVYIEDICYEFPLCRLNTVEKPCEIQTPKPMEQNDVRQPVVTQRKSSKPWATAMDLWPVMK